MCSARPAAVPSAWDPARGCNEGIEPLGNSYALAPCPVSHLHAAAAVRAGSVPEITQGYKYYK